MIGQINNKYFDNNEIIDAIIMTIFLKYTLNDFNIILINILLSVIYEISTDPCET